MTQVSLFMLLSLLRIKSGQIYSSHFKSFCLKDSDIEMRGTHGKVKPRNLLILGPSRISQIKRAAESKVQHYSEMKENLQISGKFIANCMKMEQINNHRFWGFTVQKNRPYR